MQKLIYYLKDVSFYRGQQVFPNQSEKEDGIYVGGTKILKTVKVSNGWIHVIDNVLVPAE